MKPEALPYMLIFRDTSAIFKAMSPEERQRILEHWNAWFDRLTAEGKLQQGHPLKREGRVVSQSGGRVIDGPFVESKEAIGGFFLLTVGCLEEATEIAKECPSLRIGITVEGASGCRKPPRIAGRLAEAGGAR